MYAMFHGAYGHTMETPYRDVRGVDAHYATVWGALNFVAQNRQAMVRDQVEIFRRGFLSLPQQPIPPELLPQWPQYQDVIPNHFPAAYVIPADEPFQVSPQAPARLVDFLLFNDVQVETGQQGLHVERRRLPGGDLRRLAESAEARPGQHHPLGRPGSLEHPWAGVLLAAHGVDAPRAVGRAPRGDGRADGPPDARGQQG